MKVLINELKAFEPGLENWSADRIADALTQLGFEAVVETVDRIDCSITPNRGDAMSALGLARELRAWIHRSRQHPGSVLRLHDTSRIDRLPIFASPKINISDSVLVPTYDAVLFEGISVQPSPKWLAKAVTDLGWHSINNIVDLSNYLMDRFGQPLHAFDVDAILGDTMRLRSAKLAERITTLDGIERVLPQGALVIEDRDGLIDLAGIMGAKNSGINGKTSRVLLQAATFDREAIRSVTQALGLRTQAAVRYERGVDPSLGRSVLNEAIGILKQADFGKARAIGQWSAATANQSSTEITVKPEAINQLLGTHVKPDLLIKLFELIGCEVALSRDKLLVKPPAWRYDLTIWQDFADEVIRFIGLNDGLISKKLKPLSLSAISSQIEWSEGLKDRLIDLGLNEILTYSFVHRSSLDALDLPVVGELVNAVNPTLKYLRPSLLPGLALVAAANATFDPIGIFEIGHVFTRTTEEMRLGILIAGDGVTTTDMWLVRLADAIGLDSADIKAIAMITEFSDQERNSFKLRKSRVTGIEIRLSDLKQARSIPKAYRIPTESVAYQPISRFPAVVRDIAVVIPLSVAATAVEQFVPTVTSAIESIRVFDEFASDRFGLGKKSLAFHIRYADPDRTLTDAEVDQLHELVTTAIETTFGAVRR